MAKRIAVLAVNPVDWGCFSTWKVFTKIRLSTVCMQLRKLLICVLIQVSHFAQMIL